MPSPSTAPTFMIDPDAAELTILVEGSLPQIGWEQVLTNLEVHIALVDIVILAGTAWGTANGRRIELLLREALPEQGVPVVHADDPRLERWRAAPRRRRGPGRRYRAPTAW